MREYNPVLDSDAQTHWSPTDVASPSISRPQFLLSRNRTLLVVALSLAYGFALFSRSPDVILKPQFWAEDGAVFYQQAHEFGFLHTALVPYNGYLHLFPRLIAGLSLFLPLSFAPFLFNVASLVVQCLPAIYISTARMQNIGPLKVRVLLAFLYLGLPNIGDIYGTPTNAQWHLAVLCFLILIATPPRGLLGTLFDVIALLIGALSGPFCIMLLPVALVVAVTRGGSWTVKQIAILGLAAVVQVMSLVLNGRPNSEVHLGASLSLFSKILAYQVFLSVFPGSYRIVDFVHAPLASLLLRFSAIGIGLGLMAYILVRGTLEIRCLTLFAGLVLAASLVSPLATRTGTQWDYLLLPGSCPRYWYIPRLTITAATVWLATQSTSKLLRGIGLAFVLLVLVDDALHWRFPPPTNLHFDLYVRAFNALPIGSHLIIPINPSDWSLALTKTIRDPTSYATGPSGTSVTATSSLRSDFHVSAPEMISDVFYGSIDKVNGALVTELGNPMNPVHVPVRSGALIEGWAGTGDRQHARPLDQIYCLNSDILVKGEHLPRLDLVLLSHNRALERAGYIVFLPSSALRPGLQAITLIAYSENDKKLCRYPQVLYVYGD
jgi:hypothetical protein